MYLVYITYTSGIGILSVYKKKANLFLLFLDSAQLVAFF